MARTGLAIGGVVLIGVGAAIAFGVVMPSEFEATDEVTQPIHAVAIDNDSGNVTVRAGGVTTTTVRQQFEYRWDQPGDAFAVEGTTLALRGCGWACTVDYEVVVPRGTTVIGSVDSGDITLEGVDDVRVSADSGSITGERINGSVVEVDVDSGDIELHLTRAADVRAQANSGDIELSVPQGEYQVGGDTDSGSREIQVADVPGAPAVLDLDTDSGDVTVTGT